MGGLMKGYADGLQDSRARNAESSAAAAQQEAYDADRRAARAERHAAEVTAIAASWKREALLNRGSRDGLMALFLALYDVHVEPLQGEARDNAQMAMSAAAKKWISSKFEDEAKALIRDAWGSLSMQSWNQKGCLVGPQKPKPFTISPSPTKPGEITEVLLPHMVFFTRPGWAFGGVEYRTEEDAVKAQVDAITKYKSEHMAWLTASESAYKKHLAQVAEYDGWISKYGEDF